MIKIHVLYVSGIKETHNLIDKGNLWLTYLLTDLKKDKKVLRAFALRETV
jgi:hypothetical protein